jgi:hypothetical protein
MVPPPGRGAKRCCAAAFDGAEGQQQADAEALPGERCAAWLRRQACRGRGRGRGRRAGRRRRLRIRCPPAASAALLMRLWMACSSVVSATSGAGVPQSMRVASGTWGRRLRQRSAMPCSQRRRPCLAAFGAQAAGAEGEAAEDASCSGRSGRAAVRRRRGRCPRARVAGQFAGDDGHRAQRCAQLVGGAGGEVAQGDDALVAQAGLAGLGQRLVAAANGSVMRTTYHTMTPPTPRR